MYSIKVSGVKTVDNKSFRKPAELKGKRVTGKDGEVEMVDASYLDMLGAFLHSLFPLVAAKGKDNKELKPLTIEDSSYAMDIFRAMHVADGVLELEKAPYEWLKLQLTTYGVDVFQVNAAIILEPLKSAEETTPNRAETRRLKKG